MIGVKDAEKHPLDAIIRADRMPHIWCPGCGIGIVMRCYAQAILDSGLPADQHVVVSGIGCSGRVAGYMNIDSYHTTHGRAIPFAVGIKLAKPELMTTVFSGDGDLAAIGGNHLIHAARRNVDVNVICVNNFNYGMTGGQVGPTTPRGARGTTAPYGNPELPFNLPYLLAAAGANFVARWTTIHVRQIRDDILYAFTRPGFTFIEVLAPCPVGFGKSNNIDDGLEEMELYRQRCVLVRDGDVSQDDLNIDLREETPIYIGRFVDRDRPPYEAYPGGDIMRQEVRIAGFGGQGVVLAGYVLGKALALYSGLEAVMTQSHGPEARGGASSADLVVSTEPIAYPFVQIPDYLVAMSQEAYTKFRPTIKVDAMVLIDRDLVKPHDGDQINAIPATQLAEDLGRRIVTNVVMLGYVTALTEIVKPEAMLRALEDTLNSSILELNIKAFYAGLEFHTKHSVKPVAERS